MAAEANKKPSPIEALKYTIYTAIVFLAISAPFTYRITASLFGKWVASPQGLPTAAGLLLHTVVFGAILYGLMFIGSSH